MRVQPRPNPQMSSLPLCFPPPGMEVQALPRDTPALLCAMILPASQGCQEWALPGVGIARRLPGDNLPHSLRAPRCAPDSRPAPVFWLLRRFQGFPGNARSQPHSPGSLLEPLVLLGSPSILLWAQAWIWLL